MKKTEKTHKREIWMENICYFTVSSPIVVVGFFTCIKPQAPCYEHNLQPTFSFKIPFLLIDAKEEDRKHITQ